MQDTRYDGNWHQIGGDVNAATYGARFARVDAHNNPYDDNRLHVSIHIMDVAYAPELDEAQPYHVTEYEYDADELTFRAQDNRTLGVLGFYANDEWAKWEASTLARAIKSIGMPADFTWDGLTLCEALFDYGVSDERQPSTYFDEYGAQFPTLRAVMDDYAIPASVLWQPSEYDEPAPDLD